MPIGAINRGAAAGSTAAKPKPPWAKQDSSDDSTVKPSETRRKASATANKAAAATAKPDDSKNVAVTKPSTAPTSSSKSTDGGRGPPKSEPNQPKAKSEPKAKATPPAPAPAPTAAPVSGKPPPPPPAPAPPPPPPSMGKLPPVPGGQKKTPEQIAKIEQLRKGQRRIRPDWGTMMKEIEDGRKLKHVQCNDRSKPIIPRMKSLGKFVFDSEAKPASKTDAIHNKLLTEIQGGIKLKKVQCNDRSKPILIGLRKFRRQLTTEDATGRTSGGEGGLGVGKDAAVISVADIPPEEFVLGDEADDIDALRDDLQSAKQMLELEIEGKAKLGKDNRDLQCQIIAIEAENEKLKAQLGLIPESQVSALVRRESRAFKELKKSKSGLYKSSSGIKKCKSGFPNKEGREREDSLGELNELEEEVQALNAQVVCVRNSADEWEAKFREVSRQLLLAQGKFEDSEQKRTVLEKKLELAQSRKGVSAVVSVEKSVQTEDTGSNSQSRRVSRQSSIGRASESHSLGSGEDAESDDDDHSDLEMDEATVLKKKQEQELKLWENKLRSIREKQNNCKRERSSLKAEQKRMEAELKGGKARLKDLQKEVDKMANLMKKEAKEDGEEDEEEEESEEESESESSEEEEEESEEEESEESSEEVDSEGEHPGLASHEQQLAILTNHIKKGEGILGALRKGNFLLRANIDHLKDDLEGVRIKYHDLEHELNIVLSDV